MIDEQINWYVDILRSLCTHTMCFAHVQLTLPLQAFLDAPFQGLFWFYLFVVVVLLSFWF